jgi:hypothetical protein
MHYANPPAAFAPDRHFAMQNNNLVLLRGGKICVWLTFPLPRRWLIKFDLYKRDPQVDNCQVVFIRRWYNCAQIGRVSPLSELLADGRKYLLDDEPFAGQKDCTLFIFARHTKRKNYDIDRIILILVFAD